jgi:hypothetical protein
MDGSVTVRMQAPPERFWPPYWTTCVGRLRGRTNERRMRTTLERIKAEDEA